MHKDRMNDKPIIIWGGAMYGEIAYKMITSVYGGKVEAIIDNKFAKVDWADVKIIRSSELDNIHDVTILICAANSFNVIKKQLKQYEKNGIEVKDICNILKDFKEVYKKGNFKIASSYLYGDLDLDEIVERYCYYAGIENGYDKKLYLPYCVLCITSKCSLKCKNCAAFITKYKQKKDYTLSYVKENFGQILDAVDGILELELMGGEPFLCSEFNDILLWCIHENKIRAVKIVTNGTIMPGEDTWEILKHNKVKLVVDDYGNYSYKFKEIIEEAEKRSVRCEKQRLQSWYQIEPIEKHGFAQEQLENIFSNCNFRTCIGMTNGRFYHCNVAGHMNAVGMLEDCDSDYIQLEGVSYESGILRNKIKALLNCKYIKACDFCSLYLNKEIKVAEQE